MYFFFLSLQSFFGRTYSNISSLSDCKNSGRCVINKKTRTSCKSCRLRKCLVVGMSKSGSRYGRRSNWFKIHFLMQNNSSENAANTISNNNNNDSNHNNNINADNSNSGLRVLPVEDKIKSWNNSKLDRLVTSLDDCSDEKWLSSKGDSSFSGSSIHPNQNLSPDHKEIISKKDESLETTIKKSESPDPSSSSLSSSSDLNSSLQHFEDIRDKNFWSSVSDSFYPKDLVALYRIPAMHRLHPYLNPVSSLPPQLLYPYYSLLSLFSKECLEPSVNKDKLTTPNQRNLSPTSVSREDIKSENFSSDNLQPPFKIFKQNTSAFQPTCGLENLWNTTSLHCSSQASPQIWKPASSPYDKPLKLKLKKEKNLDPISSENLPIDLSIRPKSIDSEVSLKYQNISLANNECSVVKETSKNMLIINDKEKNEYQTEQQIPLDLSGFKT